MKQKHIYMALGGVAIIVAAVVVYKLVKKRGLRMQSAVENEEELPENTENKTDKAPGTEI
jgi:flagellar biosynthesis/type III secretory pathway M-ring protein FliF/YscJ